MSTGESASSKEIMNSSSKSAIKDGSTTGTDWTLAEKEGGGGWRWQISSFCWSSLLGVPGTIYCMAKGCRLFFLFGLNGSN